METSLGDTNGSDEEDDGTVDVFGLEGTRCTLSREEVPKHLDAVEEFVVTCDCGFLRDRYCAVGRCLLHLHLRERSRKFEDLSVVDDGDCFRYWFQHEIVSIIRPERLVRILRDLRAFLTESGARFLFDTRVEGFLTKGGGAKGSIRGLKLAGGGELLADKVILSVGHSARGVYERLLDVGVSLEAKGIAVGFRIEHPQALIDEMRYGPELASMVNRGKGKVPVADYRLTQSLPDRPRLGEAPSGETGDDLPNSGSRKAAMQDRSCYSFCMCPGGQVVPTSVDPKEVCVNGMSFSRRDSRWANAALVVSLTSEDVAADMVSLHGEGDAVGPLRGVRWQSTMERRAAVMGGGDLVVPVQRVTDFMVGASSREASLPSSSYRLGVRAGPLHELYPTHVTEGLRQALEAFEERMPGFVCDEALLHGVETRTSAPVQIERDPSTLECPSMEGLFPAGEGAGYAGELSMNEIRVE